MLKLAAVVLILATGCVATPPNPSEPMYRNIPDALLQKCELPPLPESNGDATEGFIQAWLCGDQGNRDKAAVRELLETVLDN